ncbi:MAG: NTP transferase domain-containing protein [Chloroflexi bacterium]|nr:NTP transferase domain-containing protein [Chloroflexota bacterium]
MRRAIILAQGTGSKLWPFSTTRPKAAVPVGGAPLLQQQIRSLAAEGIDSIIVVATSRFEAHLRHLVSGKGEQSLGAAGMGRLGDSTPSSNVQVLAWDPPQGTAVALHYALQSAEDEPVLVLYGDMLWDPETLSKLLSAHREDPGTPLVLAAPLHELENQTMYLAIRVQKGCVEEVIAHPRHSVTHRLAGAFVFQPKMILPYLDAHPGYVAAIPSGGMPPQNEADLAQTIQMMIEDGLPVRAVEPVAFALDIDRPWDILAANYVWLGFLGQALSTNIIHSSARISERADIQGHVVLGENAVIGPGVVIEGNVWIDKDAVVTNGAIIGGNTYIGPHTQIKDYALLGERTSIGPRCKIGYCAEIHGVLFGRSTVMHQCEVWGVLGEAVDIGAGTVFGTLRFDDQPQPHRVKGRWETPQYASCATFIGDFCRTGVNAIFMPGSKVGAYSAIGPGVMISGDVPENSLLLLKQEVERKEWGPAKYGW